MSNLDNQSGRDDRPGLNRTPNDRISIDNSKTGMGMGTIAAIVAAVLIAGTLMLFGPWGNDRTAINNSTPATTNSAPGTTTGQTSSAPRVITPNVAPAPTTTAPAPAAR